MGVKGRGTGGDIGTCPVPQVSDVSALGFVKFFKRFYFLSLWGINHDSFPRASQPYHTVQTTFRDIHSLRSDQSTVVIEFYSDYPLVAKRDNGDL